MEYAIDLIKRHRKIQFGWSRTGHFLMHKGIVVLLDGDPAFTIDYGKSGIDTTLWGRQNSHVEGVLFTSTNQDVAVQLVEELNEISMGDYKLFRNNCRHYVVKAVEISLKKAENDASLMVDPDALRIFYDDIETVQSIDYVRIASFGPLFVSVIAAIAAGFIFKLLQSHSF